MRPPPIPLPERVKRFICVSAPLHETEAEALFQELIVLDKDLRELSSSPFPQQTDQIAQKLSRATEISHALNSLLTDSHSLITLLRLSQSNR